MNKNFKTKRCRQKVCKKKNENKVRKNLKVRKQSFQKKNDEQKIGKK